MDTRQTLEEAIATLPRPWLQELATWRLNGLSLQQARFRQSVSWHSIYSACNAIPAFATVLARIDSFEADTVATALYTAANRPPSTAQK